MYGNVGLDRLNGGSTVPTLNRNDVHAQNVYTPPLPEQRKIADFLSAVDEKIAHLSRKKALLADYKKGCMQQLFSQKIRFKDDDGNDFPDWEEKLVGDTLEFLSDYTANGSFAALKENVKYYNNEEYAALVRTTDLEKDTFIPQRFTDQRGYDFLKKTALFGGELIMSNVGNIGKVYRAPYYNAPMTLAPNTYTMRFKEQYDKDFIYQWMLTTPFIEKITTLVGGGGLKAINKSSFKSIKIMLPNLLEQRKIADFLSALDHKIDLVAQELTHARSFKAGLLQQMFV